MIDNIFKKNNIKKTKQRILVYNIVLNSKEQANIKYIHKKCLNEVDIATIYRIVDLFLEKELFVNKLDHNGNIYYIDNTFKHEHYLNCIKCNKKEKISFCPVSELESLINKENGFKIVNHNIDLSGICHDCQ